MDKRYQVFVSSTYEDLKAERQRVIQALLEFDCIPVGMEFFPAADVTQWEVIRKVIEESDYYAVIVGGRYGSLSAEGISYTQKEYEYAVSKNIPVIALLHRDPGKIPFEKSESSEESRRKLKKFRSLCEKKMCNYWENADELARKVTSSLTKLMKDTPRIGWIRDNSSSNETQQKAIIRLEQLVVDQKNKKVQPSKEESLTLYDIVQGNNEFSVNYRCSLGIVKGGRYTYRQFKSNFRSTWNKLFSVLSPFLLNEISSEEIKNHLENFVLGQVSDSIKEKTHASTITFFKIDEHEINDILIQYRSMGLITISECKDELKRGAVYWVLTPAGDEMMSAIRRFAFN